MATEKWAVDARELLLEIERIYDDHYFRSNIQCVHDIFNAIRRIVRRYATFRVVEVVHGRWEQDGIYYRCSVCHKLTMMPHLKGLARFNYCPYCGAKNGSGG